MWPQQRGRDVTTQGALGRNETPGGWSGCTEGNNRRDNGIVLGVGLSRVLNDRLRNCNFIQQGSHRNFIFFGGGVGEEGRRRRVSSTVLTLISWWQIKRIQHIHLLHDSKHLQIIENSHTYGLAVITGLKKCMPLSQSKYKVPFYVVVIAPIQSAFVCF